MKAGPLTSRSLLFAFLDLQGLTPELNDWTEERLADNPPRLIRLRRLIALFQAFGLPWEPTGFTQGKFLKLKASQERASRYGALLSKYRAEMPEEYREAVKHHFLPSFFEVLFGYRSQLERALSFPSGFLAASGLFLHALQKMGDVNRAVRDRVIPIDDILAELISPEGASFSVGHLAQEFGYPDVNLFEIDTDWV